MAEKGTKDNPYKSYDELVKSGNYYTGDAAVKEVEKRLDKKLSPEEKRIIALEGFVDGFYLDDRGVLTRGVGQTGIYTEGSSSLSGFQDAFNEHVERAKAREGMEAYDTYSPDLKKELLQAEYRGDLGQSPLFRKLLSEAKSIEDYNKAADMFLKNEDYLKRKKEGGDGVTQRMEEMADAVRKEGQRLYSEPSIEDQIEQRIMQDRNQPIRDEKGLENLIKQQSMKYGDQAMNNSPEMYGRYGDDTMVHMSQDEVRGLEALAAANGGMITTNPVTGYREAFNLGGVLGAVAPIAAGFAFPGFGASLGLGSGIAAGALTGAGIAALSGDNALVGGLTGGLGGAGGAGLSQAYKAASVSPGMTTGQLNKELISPFTKSGADLAGKGVGQTLSAADATSGLATGGGYNPATGSFGAPTNALTDVAYTGQTSAMEPVSSALERSTVTPGLGDVAKEYGYGRSALLGAGALAGGLEESDLYPSIDPDEVMDPRLKYDPTRRLSLNMDTGIGDALTRDTGLRLLAKGGKIKNYVMGGPLAGQEKGPPPEYGIIDVGGKFVKTSDEPGEGLISKTDYKEQYVTTAGENKEAEGSSSGDMEAVNKAAKGGIDPAAALNAIQAVASYNQPAYADQTYGLDTLTNGQNMALASGGYLETGGMIGDGMSDDIKANIDGMQEARLSDGEFVIPADVVSHLGNGSSDAGAKKLYNMMDRVRKARTGTKKQGKEIKPENFMPK